MTCYANEKATIEQGLVIVFNNYETQDNLYAESNTFLELIKEGIPRPLPEQTIIDRHGLSHAQGTNMTEAGLYLLTIKQLDTKPDNFWIFVSPGEPVNVMA